MSIRTALIVACALAFGGMAAAGVHLATSRGGGDGKDMATIVVAAADVPRGDSITAEMVVARPYPKDLLPAGVLTRVEDAVGRAASSPMVKDEPVLERKLAPKGSGRGLAALIRPGMRAITVQTPNVATGVAGFIVPGNKVDVLMTMQDVAGGEKPMGGTITLLEDVEILAVDQKVDAPAENRVDAAQMRSVTLLVTPEDAAKLTLGQDKGTLHLSLRNMTDSSKAPARPATVTGLYDRRGLSWDERARLLIAEFGRATARRPAEPPIPAPAPAPPPARTIRTLRGTAEGIVRLEHPSGPPAGSYLSQNRP